MSSVEDPAARVRFLRWLAVVVAAVAVVSWWLTREPREAREIARLPTTERRALFDRTMTTLRTTCAHDTGPGLMRYCHEQAEFVASFPECDEACREVVERFVGPTR